MRIATQDRAALSELYLVYHRRLARFLSRLTHRHELVEEIINDVFWIVWRKAEGFRGESRVSTWLIGIAYRRALKVLQRNQLRGVQVDYRDVKLLAPDDIETAEQQELLTMALATLPMEQRMVLELTYYMGRSCEEIAVIAECPVNTVKTRMFHARRKLKQLLPALDGSLPYRE